MNEKPVISVKNLTKRYGDVTALNQISVDIPPGVTGLIGPNGAGKTTLLMTLLGLIFPDNGHAQVLGYDVVHDSLEIRRKVGVLHERPNYPEYMEVEDYLTHVADLYETSRNPAELLEMVGLQAVGHRRIHSLSGGMLRRLGVAQALVGTPEMAFLDEPTSNLDVDGRDEIINLLGELSKKYGVHFLLSSHILTELERICDNVVFIKNGDVIGTGKTSDILSDYSHNRYRVTCSDSLRLAEALQEREEFQSIRALGTKVVTFTFEGENMARIWDNVEAICKEIKIDIDSLGKSETLDDAYREIMK
ncbi:MAG: ATP-binding cassette domain-containing protein [Candidatus Lokiarchaeota archaeon]|nr:ATP-binding cassette domain-containing protein [Candidatus Lokiarchaeota archaeon]